MQQLTFILVLGSLPNKNVPPKKQANKSVYCHTQVSGTVGLFTVVVLTIHFCTNLNQSEFSVVRIRHAHIFDNQLFLVFLGGVHMSSMCTCEFLPKYQNYVYKGQ